MMKNTFFFLAMLASVATSAQTLSIKITNIDYFTKIAICDLSWTGRDAYHRSDVWVFVDYIELSGNTTTGSWQPAGITGATVTASTTGSAAVATETGNTRGVWIKSNTYGAAFTGKIAIQLNNVPAIFNACAYATDYPPNATSYNAGTYTLKGTKSFKINGAMVNDNKYTVTKITSMTDATGCPGGVGRDAVHNGGICAPRLTAVGSYCRDLVADGASTCTNCGFEFKYIPTAVLHSAKYTLCPAGWHVAQKSEIVCIRTNCIGFLVNLHFWVEGMSGEDCEVGCQVNGTNWTFLYKADPDNCNGTITSPHRIWCIQMDQYNVSKLGVVCAR
jgi:hypothetical protein